MRKNKKKKMNTSCGVIMSWELRPYKSWCSQERYWWVWDHKEECGPVLGPINHTLYLSF